MLPSWRRRRQASSGRSGEGLSELGYVEGKNIAIELGLARREEQLPDIAAELVNLRVEVLVASGTPAVVPARNATRTIPVVFVAGIDPIAIGLVASLCAAGRKHHRIDRATCRSHGETVGAPQRDHPLAVPRRAPGRGQPIRGHEQYVREAAIAAQRLGMELQVLSLRAPNDYEEAFRAASEVGALLQVDDAVFTSHRRSLIELAARYGLPVFAGFQLPTIPASWEAAVYWQKISN